MDLTWFLLCGFGGAGIVDLCVDLVVCFLGWWVLVVGWSFWCVGLMGIWVWWPQAWVQTGLLVWFGGAFVGLVGLICLEA